MANWNVSFFSPSSHRDVRLALEMWRGEQFRAASLKTHPNHRQANLLCAVGWLFIFGHAYRHCVHLYVWQQRRKKFTVCFQSKGRFVSESKSFLLFSFSEPWPCSHEDICERKAPTFQFVCNFASPSCEFHVFPPILQHRINPPFWVMFHLNLCAAFLPYLLVNHAHIYFSSFSLFVFLTHTHTWIYTHTE